MTTPDLLPCPFCGNVDALMVQHLEGTILHPAYRVTCDHCGASSRYTDLGDHKAIWNRRTPDPAAIRAEALEEAARVADRAETEFWKDWKEGADPHDLGKSDGATEVAARLRAPDRPAGRGRRGWRILTTSIPT